ncbi:MAG TPA: response regulator [Pseudolabrys sp.]|nr:response regulator [Pseudolabrys sp.]
MTEVSGDKLPPERARVLVVEDEMLLAMLMEDTLADFGCDVVGPVAHIADGLRLANTERLDGAILDINVAGSDVFPVARELAKRSIPFVFVSGYGAGNLPQEWRDRPTLQKPFDPRDLARSMAKTFAKRRMSGMSGPA